MTINVGIDARSLNVRHVRGTGRYVYELLRNTTPEDGVAWTIFGHDCSLPLQIPQALSGSAAVFEMRGHRFQTWEQIGLPRRLRRSTIDVYHGADNTLPLLQPRPMVVTIHDTGLWSDFNPNRLARHYLHDVQRLALRRCAAVVTISEASRRDIAARWPFVEDRLIVIPHGIADEFFAPACTVLPAALVQSIAGRPYLLFMGGPHPRKRFGWALEVMGRLNRPDLCLVCAGFPPASATTQAVPEQLRGRVHFAPFLKDAELVAVYQGALATLYPTRYEGFGFPAIESQSAGTPAIFSPVTSLVDLVGPLAWTPPIEDMDAWVAAVHEILSMCPKEREERAVRARSWARGFSWRRSLDRHISLYRELASKVSRSAPLR